MGMSVRHVSDLCPVYGLVFTHTAYRSENVSFKIQGLSAEPNKNPKLKPLIEILRENGHSNTKISYLKMDIEGMELQVTLALNSLTIKIGQAPYLLDCFIHLIFVSRPILS